MKSRFISVGIILTCLLGGVVSAQQASQPWNLDPYNPEYEHGVVLVKLQDKTNVHTLDKFSGSSVLKSIKKIIQVEETEQLFPHAKHPQKRMFKDFSGKEHQVGDLRTIFKLTFSDDRDAKEIAEEISTLPGVEFAEPDYFVYAMEGNGSPLPQQGEGKPRKTTATVPNDPLYSQQWYLGTFPGVNAEAAWDSTTGDTTQIIAIIDTGVDWDHPDLDDNIWRNWGEVPGNFSDDDGNGYTDDIRGWDFVNNDNNPNDDNSHGTHVAGIAAAEGNNSVGICGVAWNARIMPVKMLQSSGSGSSSDLALAINYAADNGATVINMSLGSYGESYTVKTALENAYSSAVLVAAAGNDGYRIEPPLPYAPMYPACYGFVIGVEATQSSSGDNGYLAGFSNYDPSGPVAEGNSYGHNYEIEAPGVQIHSTFPNGNYRELQGTSMACPVVAGSVALLNDLNPLQSTEQLFASLIQGANSSVLDIHGSMTVTLAPDLQYMTYTLIDTLPGCDDDGEADIGETVEIFVTVKNAGGLVDSVWAKLIFSEYEDTTIADIVDSLAFFGNMSAYASLTNYSDPLKIDVNENTANNRDMKFELQFFDKDNTLLLDHEIIISAQNGVEVSGWIDVNTTWQSQYRYLVVNNILVNTGVILSIEPGTEVLINPARYIQNKGTIVALGKKDSVITFTVNSSIDEQWYGFSLQGTETQTDTNYSYIDGTVFRNCIFKKANGYSMNHVLFDSCTFQDSNTPSGVPYSDYLHGNPIIINSIVQYNQFGNNPSFFSGTVLKNNIIRANQSSNQPGSYLFQVNAGVAVLGNGIYNNTIEGAGSYMDNFPKIINILNGDVYHNSIINNIISNSNTDPNYDNTYGVVIGYETTPPIQFASNNLINDSEFFVGYQGYNDNDISGNYFGINDSSFISNRIHDRTFDYNFLGYGNLEFMPILNSPSPSAPAIIDSILIDDEYLINDIPIVIGNGTAEIKIRFSRPMNISLAPTVTFGVREPYTQHQVNVSSGWSTDSLYWIGSYVFNVETGDGVNTFIIDNAEDATFFPMCRENRHKFNLQAASSLSSDFIAYAGVGEVDLEWPSANSPDVLGYNMYRAYQVNDSTWSDTTSINTSLITDTTYTDFNVIPDTTYHYAYKVLGTDMAESDYSKFVTAVPVDASSGDANGDMVVNVQDVVAIVNYILEENPEPFLFEAADVNDDGYVNVLDVVGTVNLILGGTPKAMLARNAGSQATLSLYKDRIGLMSDGGLAGLQFVLKGEEAEKLVLKPSSALKGFEIAKTEKEGKIICVIYSLSRQIMPEGDNTLFTFEEKKDLDILNAVGCTGRGESIALTVENKSNIKIPEKFTLFQNYPNPFNPETIIKYGLPQASEVKIAIYNVLGQKVRTMDVGEKEAGYHQIIWDSKDDYGIKAATGVYIYRIEAGKFVESRKMILLR